MARSSFFFRIPSFVVTLGMLSIARGMTVIYTSGTPISDPAQQPLRLSSAFPRPPSGSRQASRSVMGGLLTLTTFGRYTFAIGGDEDKTRILGVPVRRA